MKRKKLLALLLAAAMLSQSAVTALAADNQSEDNELTVLLDEGQESVSSKTYLTEETVITGADTRYAIPDEDVEFVKGLGSASISVQFKTTSTNLQAVAAINSTVHTDDYISLYISGGNRIGFEMRDVRDSGNINEHKYVDVANAKLADGNWHTITLVVDENTGYQIWLDGQQVMDTAVTTTYFTKNLSWEPSSVTFGGANRISGNSYLYNGSIKNAKLYNGVIDEEQIYEDHKETYREEETPVYGEDTKKTEEYGIYDMGEAGSYNYRIPAMVTTKNGVLIAAADQRNTHWSDWGNIDTVVRRSTDGGATWSEVQDVIDLKSQPYFSGTQSAYTIDPILLATDSGRVWMLVDMFAESTNGSQGTWSVKETGTGFITAEDGNKYLALYDSEGTAYTLRDGEVYDSDGNKTDYTVDSGKAENAYHNYGDLYENGEYVGNIYLRSQSTDNDSAPLNVFQTSYLMLFYSDDDGATWSQPINITGQVKPEWSKFCGAGPGFGIELKNGEHAGRLIFPIYYTTTGSGIGFQSSACIYSDDGGETWQRGESPNDGRINSSGSETSSQNPSGIDEMTESQIIELNNGHLLQFMRNTGSGKNKVAVARSTDGGATWEDPYYTDATEVYCQLSVLHYPETVDGKELIVMSNPGGTGRANGTLRIGEVDAEDNITWVTTKLFCPGNYAYSCLTYIGDGMMGLLYEHANTIKYTSFNLDYIKDEANIVSPNISSVTSTVERKGEHTDTLAGDTIVFTVTVDQKVTVKGDPTFYFQIGGQTRYAEYRSISGNGKVLTFAYKVQKEDKGNISYRGPKILSDTENRVANASDLPVSALDTELDLGYVGADPSNGEHDISMENVTITTGSYQNDAGPENAIDGDEATMWHSKWNSGHNRAEHWLLLDFGETTTINGIRYLPRATGSNGIITKYQLLVSDDGETFEEVITDTWAGNNEWKMSSFDTVTGRYYKLVVLDALSDQAANDFASAREICLTYTEPVVENPFEDVVKEENKFYYDAVLWAVDNGITTGVTATTFCPDNACTRAQVVMFLYKSAGTPEIDPSIPNPFSDVHEGGTFYEAIMWAYQNGITTGYTDGTFRPLDNVSRGEYIAFQYRAAGKPKVSIANPFSDVAEGYTFYDAIMWAAKNGITLGQNGRFLAADDCSRGHVVTFLYRANHLSK